eukprot:scaffold269999_cov30-Tisochrysis_lutea.AAC.1
MKLRVKMPQLAVQRPDRAWGLACRRHSNPSSLVGMGRAAGKQGGRGVECYCADAHATERLARMPFVAYLPRPRIRHAAQTSQSTSNHAMGCRALLMPG